MRSFDYSHESVNSPFDENQELYTVLDTNTIFKLLVLLVLLYLVWSDTWSIQFVHKGKQTEIIHTKPVAQAASLEIKAPPVGVSLPASAKSHTAFYVDPSFAQRHSISTSDAQKAQNACTEYVQRYNGVAIAEMKKYGIPASITLAQGLLESNAGHSRLATKTNNHFGIKCFSRKCKKGHCKNFTDDTHKDFFVTYPNIWGSFRAHSKFLKNGKRYRSLFELNKHDYKAWAHGLKKAGYATDSKYAYKLIALIENLDLHRFDTV